MRHIYHSGIPTTEPEVTASRRIAAVIRAAFITLLKAYRYIISPLLGNNCRFYPSCSSYAETAVSRFGVIKGSWLSLKRLGKCHPWHEGGLDPVPGCDHSSSTEH